MCALVYNSHRMEREFPGTLDIAAKVAALPVTV